MNGVQTRFKCKLDVKRCKRFVFPPSSLLPRSNALKTKAIRYFQTDRTLTRIVSPPLQETEVVIVTLPEATPVFEAERLQKDLQRAGINNKWWVVNACLSLTDTENSFLRAKAQNELTWIKKVEELSKGNAALIAWKNN